MSLGSDHYSNFQADSFGELGCYFFFFANRDNDMEYTNHARTHTYLTHTTTTKHANPRVFTAAKGRRKKILEQ